jgi:ABC-type transporter Mla subunit MlaD
MSEKPSAFRIGLFVLAGVAILFGGLFLFGLRSALEKTHRFETYVTGDVEGLSKGSAVKLRGVEVGKVSQIGFSWILYPGGTPRCVVIRFEVKESVSPVSGETALEHEAARVIGRGLRAIVKAQGITGTSVLSLDNVDPAKFPPLSVSWRPKYFYVPSAPSQLGQMLAALEKTLTNLEKLDVGALMASVDRTLDSADAALKRIGQLNVEGISRDVNQVAADASATVLEIRALASDARHTLQAMQLERVGQDADRLIRELDGDLEALIQKLSAIDVRALNDTLAGTRDAARNLNDALEELKRHPSGFLFGGAPPPASGLEKEKKP